MNMQTDHPFAYDLNPYESFMKKHLSHYGYYTGRNETYRTSIFHDWDKTHGYGSDSDSEYENKAIQDDREKDGDSKSTQVVFDYEAGKRIPRLREPRQLYALSKTQQHAPRYPADMQILPEPVTMIEYIPKHPDPYYKTSGFESNPMVVGVGGGGRLVFHSEATRDGYFIKSRVGGSRKMYEVNYPVDDETLRFDSRFESGNLEKVVKVGDYDYELTLRNDLYTDKHTQWFYFRVQNAKAGLQYRFTIINLMKPNSLYNMGMKPLIYSEHDAKLRGLGWVRVGHNINYYKNNLRRYDQNKYYHSLTWTVIFPNNNDTYYLAHCYPYTHTHLQTYLQTLSDDPVKSKFCRQRVLCRTLAGNMCYILTITTPSKSPDEARGKKAVVVTARVHPGETPGSWMMKGLIDYLVGESADAKLLRDMFIFKIVPMLNPDGVIVGNYRCSLAGRDLNRNYKSVLKESFPTIWHTRAMIKRLKEEREVVVYCDFHGHSRKNNVFIYGCDNRRDPGKRLRERIFPLMIHKNAPDKFSYSGCKFRVQKSKDGTGRIVMWNLGIMNSFTMEATFGGSSLGKIAGSHFNTADFESLGYHFCDTLLDYCDPDKTKYVNTLLELEEKLRQEIATRLAKKGAGTVDKEDINIDEEYSSSVESSTSGSDSSASNGLPVHLLAIAEKLLPKKKKLKTRKERDELRKSSSKQDSKSSKSDSKTPTDPLELKTKKANPPPVSVNKTQKIRYQHRRQSVSGPDSDLHTNNNNNYNYSIPQHNNTSEMAYLDEIAGNLATSINQEGDVAAEIPHFRYTAGQSETPQVATAGIFSSDALQSLCPQHKNMFTAQYVANHLADLQFREEHYEWDTGRRPPVSNVRPQYNYSSGRYQGYKHVVAVSAAQQRQQEMLQLQKDKKSDRCGSPIKAHPSPFDEGVDGTGQDYVRRGYSARTKPGRTRDVVIEEPSVIELTPNTNLNKCRPCQLHSKRSTQHCHLHDNTKTNNTNKPSNTFSTTSYTNKSKLTELRDERDRLGTPNRAALRPLFEVRDLPEVPQDEDRVAIVTAPLSRSRSLCCRDSASLCSCSMNGVTSVSKNVKSHVSDSVLIRPFTSEGSVTPRPVVPLGVTKRHPLYDDDQNTDADTPIGVAKVHHAQSFYQLCRTNHKPSDCLSHDRRLTNHIHSTTAITTNLFSTNKTIKYSEGQIYKGASEKSGIL